MFLENGTGRRAEFAAADGNGHGDRSDSPRVVVYSHDAQGLGHLRRNLLITRALVSEEFTPSVLLVSGLRETAAYAFPPGVDSVTLPSLGKGMNGRYFPRSLRIGTPDVVEIRRKLIASAVEAFRPDAVIVDKLPLGIFGELEPSLRWLRRHTDARLVLGLRDILDEPAAVAREWSEQDCLGTIRELYDQVWVYGDPAVCDVAAEYALPADVAAKVRYTGYLNPRHVPLARRSTQPMSEYRLAEVMDLPSGSLTLCLVGGGRDGLALSYDFVRAHLPPGHGGVLVCGPLMDPEDQAHLRAMAANRPEMRVIDFVTDPHPLVCCADRVIAMGGYNTVCEILAFHKRALIVPRVTPRTEQLIRATRFAERGLVDVVHPRDLTPRALATWIADDTGGVRSPESAIDFGGVQRLPAMLRRLLAADVGARAANGVRHG